MIIVSALTGEYESLNRMRVTILVIENILCSTLFLEFGILDENFGELATQGCLHLSAGLL